MDEQIEELEEELSSTNPTDPDEYVFISGLYEELSDLYLEKDGEDNLSKAISNLAKAIECCKTGAMTAPRQHGQKGNFWARAAQLSMSMYENFGDQKAIDDTIKFYEYSLECFPPRSEESGRVLINQANAIAERFESAKNPDPADIDEAIRKAELSREILAGTGADIDVVDNDMSTIYLSRYEVTGQASDLDRASSLVEGIVQQSTRDNPSLPVWKLNLGNCLKQKFDLYNDQTAIERAVSEMLDATALASDRDDLPRDKFLIGLSTVLYARHEMSRTWSDLIDSMHYAQEALEISREQGNPRVIGVILSDLAAYQHTYSERSKDPADLDIAITTARLALEALDADEPRRVMCSCNLANMLKHRALSYDKNETEKLLVDIREGVTIIKSLYQNPNIGRSNQAILDDVVSRLLQEMYRQESPRNLKTLEEAVAHSFKAVNSVPELSASRGLYQMQLGDLQALQYEQSQKEEHIKASINTYEECLKMPSASPWDRIVAGHRAGLLYEKLEKWEEGVQVLEKTVDLLPMLVLTSMERDSQQYALSGLSGISLLACSMALQAGRSASNAFTILEKGRGIISDLEIGTTSNDTAPDNLDDAGQQLWERVVFLRRAIQKPLSTGWFSSGYTASSVSQVSAKSQLLKEYDEKAKRLKEEYGCDISQPTTAENLTKLSDHGTVVAFLTGPVKPGALIIYNNRIQHLDLPNLTHEALAEHYAFLALPVVNGLKSMKFENYPDVNERMQSLLIWLWDSAVLPVLKHLGLYTPGSKPASLHRVYWIASGVMGVMPLHAAGHHDGSSTDNVLHYVLSSYATNSKILAKALVRSAVHPWDPSISLKGLVIGMPKTPGYTDFHNITDHVNAVKSLLPSPDSLTYKEKPSRAAVAEILPTIDIAHFVCHGVSNHIDASSSSLLLQNLEDPSAIDRLMVRDIAALPQLNARLAFLAACQTADNAQADVLEENIHIAGSLHMLGFLNVIGTMWEAEETAAAQLAKGFYSALAQEINSGLGAQSTSAVAAAFQKAVVSLRGQDPEDVVTWAPFMHFGP
ncbi:hypothetical protein TWF696_007564 [Orbilia brochopaga]|uniref:CHAT domain-containing protein n=1 Tax=Orbilia brochopaga TaxID=3140254 RepID=A0AAV9ULF3_9PEZI